MKTQWDAFTVGLIALAFIFLVLGAMTNGCSANPLTPRDEAELLQYRAEQEDCVSQFPDGGRAQDDCVQAVRTRWRARWATRFDGGGE